MVEILLLTLYTHRTLFTRLEASLERDVNIATSCSWRFIPSYSYGVAAVSKQIRRACEPVFAITVGAKVALLWLQ